MVGCVGSRWCCGVQTTNTAPKRAMQGLSGLLCAHLARWGSTTVGLCGLVMRQKLPTGRDKPLSLNFTYMHSARTLLAAQLDFRTTLLGCTAPTHTLPFPRHTHDHCCLHSGTRLLQQLHHSLATLNASPPPPPHPHTETHSRRHHMQLQQPVKHKVPPWPITKSARAPTPGSRQHAVLCCAVVRPSIIGPATQPQHA